MSDIYRKLENYLNERDMSDEYLPDEDMILMNRMLDFIMDLDENGLSDEQIEEVTEIIDTIADEDISEIFDDEDMDEAVQAKKVKIKPSEKRKRRMMYRKNRAAVKLRAKKFRRTTKYKQWLRMKKRKQTAGKTARGKRIRKFL